MLLLQFPFPHIERQRINKSKNKKTPYKSAVMSSCVHVRVRKRISMTEKECLI